MRTSEEMTMDHSTHPTAQSGHEHMGHGPSASGVGHGSHDKHAGHDPAMFRDRFWITLALSLPVIYFSHMVQELLNYTAPHFPGSTDIPWVLGTVIFVYGGWPFLT